RALTGYVIVDARPRAYAEIVRLIVRRANWGKGVADELMTAATNFIGRDRAVSLAVRHYNERALAFFAKHDFQDTGETTGEHAIPRTLLLREAYEEMTPPPPPPPEEVFDFPSAAVEPVFESLPNYNLTVEDAPLFETGQNALTIEDLREIPPEDSSLSDEQLTELEAFIARARAKKGEPAPTPEKKPTLPSRPKYDTSKIEFEIDYGERSAPSPASPPPAQPATTAAASSFEFAFEPTVVAEPIVAKESTTAATKSCPDCATALPVAARFCFSCGHPQSDPEVDVPGEQAPEDEVLILEDLPPPPEVKAAPEPAPSRKRKSNPVSPAELKGVFRDYLQDRLTAYFGVKQSTRYLQHLETATEFHRVRDGSLGTLAGWLNERESDDVAARTRRDNTLADLTEYFIVETCSELHGGLFPQRLLRHQSVDWDKVDLFQLVMDYLDFASESEVVYTDFVVMPTRALRNATRSFLQAAKDERVFFICDQSLISQAKNGFAVTDSGIYWKNVLQPAGSATFTTMNTPRIQQGHLVIDNQFFDAGGRLNLKIAVLLDKLRRM
ncbi:MAG: GNAT family N-acetyltransferase, partial [Bacteroidota bacterium]